MGMYLGIDAGGTKTECWLGDETNVLAKGTAGTVKLMNLGPSDATLRLQALVASVLRKGGADADSITRTVVGLAGSSSQVVRDWAYGALKGVVGGDLVLVGDEEIAIDAAFGPGPGILVIAGTGSNIVGRCADGRKVTVGGWGPVVGDEGSGYWIGLEAIRSALHAKDRGEQSILLDRMQNFWKLGSLGDLIAHVNAATRVMFGELTHVVVQCAEDGDLIAKDVLDRAGMHLADAVILTASKMRALECDPRDMSSIAFTGSVLGKIDAVCSRFTERVQAALPGSKVMQHAVDPLAGALWKARRG